MATDVNPGDGLREAIREAFAHADARGVVLDYTNYKGERSERLVVPIRIRFGSNAWHRRPQWLLDVFDRGKGEERTFAVAGIHSWRVPEPRPAGETEGTAR